MPSGLHEGHQELVRQAAAALEEVRLALDGQLIPGAALSGLALLGRAIEGLEAMGGEWEGALGGLADLLMEGRRE